MLLDAKEILVDKALDCLAKSPFLPCHQNIYRQENYTKLKRLYIFVC